MGAMGNFDVLPDSIAILIFSKLENAQMVAQCAMVCRRWKVLTGLVDTLTFESFKLLEKKVVGWFAGYHPPSALFVHISKMFPVGSINYLVVSVGHLRPLTLMLVLDVVI